MSDEFEAAIEEAKRLEKRSVEYAPYSGEVEIERMLDLEPKEYVDLSFRDMVNLYERTQKIISTTRMGIYAAGAPEEAAGAPPKQETSEVESRLREMTTETLKSAEEVGKEPIVIEKPPEPEAHGIEERLATEIEFETRPAEPEKEAVAAKEEAPGPQEAEKPEVPPVLAPEKEAAPAPKAVEREGPQVEVPIEKKVVVAAVPPALRESPDRAASKRYERMEEQIRATMGEQADEVTLKKKMLELTKQLFKEKTTSRREELKLQITVLKNMLAAGAGTAKAKPTAARKGGADADAHMRLFETMIATHQGELAQTKDGIIDSYNKQIEQVRKKFYGDLAMTEDSSARKKIFEAFVFAVESLVEQLPEVLKKYRDFTSKKHAAELEKLRESLGAAEKDNLARVEERLAYVSKGYDQEFAPVKGIVGRQIENLIEVAGTEIFKKPEEKPADAEARALDAVKEINETDEGTLLYFLHSKDADYYKSYERKQVSKAEAIFKAKELMAKEKGLSDSMVRKYFSHTEG